MNSKPDDWRYLGPSSFPQWLLKLLPFSKRFNAAAKIHDDGYWLGGNWENKRYEDEKFAYNVAKVCKFNIFAWLFGFIYFLSVVIFGGFFFNFHEPRNINVKKSLKPE